MILQQRKHQRSNDRTDELLVSAKHGHEDNVTRMGPISEFGISQAGVDAKDCAAD